MAEPTEAEREKARELLIAARGEPATLRHVEDMIARALRDARSSSTGWVPVAQSPECLPDDEDRDGRPLLVVIADDSEPTPYEKQGGHWRYPDAHAVKHWHPVEGFNVRKPFRVIAWQELPALPSDGETPPERTEP